jgi:hypothetical protein
VGFLLGQTLYRLPEHNYYHERSFHFQTILFYLIILSIIDSISRVVRMTIFGDKSNSR